MNQPAQQQNPPGTEQQMRPTPDHGEASYQGSGRLAGKAAVVTGGDSGIGKAVAIAFAREGADVITSYLNQHEDAEDTRKWVEDAGRTAVLVPGDLTEAANCRMTICRLRCGQRRRWSIPRAAEGAPALPRPAAAARRPRGAAGPRAAEGAPALPGPATAVRRPRRAAAPPGDRRSW